MRVKIWAVVTACVVIAVGVSAGLRLSFAQEPSDPFGPSPRVPVADNPFAAQPVAEVYQPGTAVFVPVQVDVAQYAQRQASIKSAAAALRDAKSEEARSAARKKLVDVLNNIFDEDMKKRATELQKVEDRVKKLRGLYDKRLDKQKEIVELQVKVLENEADGLGFLEDLTPRPVGWPNSSPAVAPQYSVPRPQDIYQERRINPAPLEERPTPPTAQPRPLDPPPAGGYSNSLAPPRQDAGERVDVERQPPKAIEVK
jgi:hypothetical protein